MIALVYFCIQQEKNILTLDEHDPTLQILYKAALKMFSVFKDSEINMTTKMHSFSKAVASRFEEIIKCSEGSTLAKRRLQAYAEDGRLWAHSFKRRHLSENESISVTPIDAQGKSTPASADEIRMVKGAGMCKTDLIGSIATVMTDAKDCFPVTAAI